MTERTTRRWSSPTPPGEERRTPSEEKTRAFSGEEWPAPAGRPRRARGRNLRRIKQLIVQAEAAWDRDDYAAALVDFEDVLRECPDFPDVRNRAGLCRAMLGDAEGALQDFKRAIEVNPSYAEAHLNRALVLNELGRFDEARIAFERARDLDDLPGDPFPADLGNRLAVDHAKVGDLYMHADRPDQARREYQKALDLRPNFVDIRSRLAQAYLSLDDVERAARELERVLEAHPSFVAARLRLGVSFRRMGRTDEAVHEWRCCLEVEPENRRARAYLASCGVRIEEAGRAERAGSAEGSEAGNAEGAKAPDTEGAQKAQPVNEPEVTS